ncbi:DegT/DnrJ/EryC1/StrS family aminotransferase [Acinetobacter gerneri]|uniref:DegT/DnrJ/EryC1/StrS family aminotransferase n=1 Tax=Acinetobacter gerneri TaxID=202952 RepID=UPI0023F20073|nr:DegT/DnrJ/EryC1/StrS family aminotransferase [Acinetobacter gerneri]MCH4244075.1 DegT/DnrJ/EryC1/StrS family aminotransferase [Acinetobacter gerneri]
MNREIPPTNGLPIEFKDLFSKQDLSQNLSKQLNIPKPALTCSGTVALILALETLHELEPEKNQVIIPAWTCPLVALAIIKIGFVPILCDLAADDFQFDQTELLQKISPKTLAVIATHFAGLYCDLSSIVPLAKKHSVFVIEDAAQALGAKYKQQSVGLQGDIGFFSLAFGKGLTSAEGGVLFSSNLQIHHILLEKSKKLPILRDWEIKRKVELIGYYLLYRPATLNYIYGHHLRKSLKQNDEISAVGDDFDLSDIPIHRLGIWRSRVAASAALRLPEHNQRAHRQALLRIEKLKQLPKLKIFEEADNYSSNFPFILILTDNATTCKNILDQLWTKGLGVTKLFVRAIHQYPALSQLKCDMPNAEKFAQCSFSITNSFWLDDQSFEMIFQTIKNIVETEHSISTIS